MMNKNYDIDLILTNERFEENRQRELRKDTKKRLHLKNWVKATLIVIICIVAVVLFINSLKNVSEHSTPVGNYTCNGTVLQVCTGSQEVYDYVSNK